MAAKSGPCRAGMSFVRVVPAAEPCLPGEALLCSLLEANATMCTWRDPEYFSPELLIFY